MVTHRPDLADRLLQASGQLARGNSLKAVTIDAAAALCGADPSEARLVFGDDKGLRDGLVGLYHAANRDVLSFAMREVASVEDFVRQACEAVEHYYTIFHQDPEMRDVWTEILTDRDMRETNTEHVMRNAAGLYAVLRDLLPHVDEMELTATIELMIHMTDVAARWAATRDEAKGRAMLDAFCRMIGLMGEEMVRADAANALKDMDVL
ncbi:MAG: hypothetical protein PHS60_02995 [Zavarzinia sp.]|nr:hypothetical protein [Zavarzinia sp.]